MSKWTSPGYDNVNGLIFKGALPIIIVTVTKLFNLCLKKSIFPATFKTAIVVPIAKVSDPQNDGDYRPISLLLVISKVFERVIHDKLYPFIEPLLSQTQTGFRRGFSTEVSLVRVCDEILSNLDLKDGSIAVLLDMSKAFDSVKHSTLLLKLKKIGLDENAVKLFESYLSNRSQTIRLDTIMSDERVILSGVPQGSILGPLLFVIYATKLCYQCTFKAIC
jgi:hypothetical protein